MLFNPTPQSKAHSQADNLLRNFCPKVESDPFWLHQVLFDTYFPAWRNYIAVHEQRLLPLAGSTIATFINGPLAVGYDSLRTLTSLQTRFLEVPAILTSATEILDELCNVVSSMSVAPTNHGGVHYFKNHRRECTANSRNAAHLQQRANIVSKLLADTLLLRDQVLAKEQNANMLRLNKSAVFITTLSLVYLPSSFLAVSVPLFSTHPNYQPPADTLTTDYIWYEFLRHGSSQQSYCWYTYDMDFLCLSCCPYNGHVPSILLVIAP